MKNMAVKNMGLHFTSIAAGLAAAVLLAGSTAGPAAAQWRYYDGYRAGPPNYPAYPPFPGGGEPQRQPYGSREDSDEDQGQPSGSVQQSYAAPGPIVPGQPISGGPQDDRAAAASPRTGHIVPNPTSEPAGTIVVDTQSRHLYYVLRSGEAIQYGIGVGREGFSWKGVARVARKAEWPRWIPPKDMIARRPDLPSEMSGGMANPLGARALYLFEGNRDTMYRIHGTNEPDSIGQAVSSGCIRMNNADVMDLYRRVSVGTRVVVL